MCTWQMDRCRCWRFCTFMENLVNFLGPCFKESSYFTGGLHRVRALPRRLGTGEKDLLFHRNQIALMQKLLLQQKKAGVGEYVYLAVTAHLCFFLSCAKNTSFLGTVRCRDVVSVRACLKAEVRHHLGGVPNEGLKLPRNGAMVLSRKQPYGIRWKAISS